MTNEPIKKIDLSDMSRQLAVHAWAISELIDGPVSYGRADKRLRDAEKALRAAIDNLHFAKLEGLS